MNILYIAAISVTCALICFWIMNLEKNLHVIEREIDQCHKTGHWFISERLQRKWFFIPVRWWSRRDTMGWNTIEGDTSLFARRAAAIAYCETNKLLIGEFPVNGKHIIR